jgi:gliding motility-associated-like protein
MPDGFTDFDLTNANSAISQENLSFSYFLDPMEATQNTNPIPASPFNNQTAAMVYARVETAQGCFQIAEIQLSATTTSPVDGFRTTLQQCDNDTDGRTSFDLNLATPDILAQFPANQSLSVHYYPSLEDGQLEQREITTAYTNTSPGGETIYVRIESTTNGDCFGLGPLLQLIVDPLPQFELLEQQYICPQSQLDLEPTQLEHATGFLWTDAQGNALGNTASISVNEPGTYTLMVNSENGCEFYKNTEVIASAPAELTYDKIQIDDSNDFGRIEILASDQNLGIGDYEYALDRSLGPYQDNPVFEDVAPGTHTLYVRDKNGCGTVSLEVGVIGIPKFFTPNGDSHNPSWEIEGLDPNFYPRSGLYIYDRYGKLLRQINAYGDGWDGIYDGKDLPANDYWYRLVLMDRAGNLQERKGHFSLIR